MAYWTIIPEREGAAIVIRGEGGDPHAPDRIDYDLHDSPGPIYQALLDRIRPDPWSLQADRMSNECGLRWIPIAPIPRLCSLPSGI